MTWQQISLLHRDQDATSVNANTETYFLDHSELIASTLRTDEMQLMLNRNTVSHTKYQETYFRARLALMLKPALAAMSIRKKGIEDLIRKGIIPTIASSKFIQLMTTNIIINLTGIKESVYDILGYDINSGDNSYSLIEDCVLRTSHSFSSKRR